jgi:hypothetical protein
MVFGSNKVRSDETPAHILPCVASERAQKEKEKEKDKARRDSDGPTGEHLLLLADNALLLSESGIALQPWADAGDENCRVFRSLRDLPVGLKFRTPEARADFFCANAVRWNGACAGQRRRAGHPR